MSTELNVKSPLWADLLDRWCPESLGGEQTDFWLWGDNGRSCGGPPASESAGLLKIWIPEPTPSGT